MLYIPTNLDIGLGRYSLGYESKAVQRGQIYNMELDEKIWFQFNPENFEWEEPFDWVSTGTGIYGHDIQYMGQGDVAFNLSLLFIADPNAPKVITENIAEIAVYDKKSADFDSIIWMFQRWCRPNLDTGRPSQLRVIYGKHYWDGIITRARYKIIEKFESGNIREGQIILSFRKWSPIR